MDGDEHVEVVGVYFDVNLGEGAVVVIEVFGNGFALVLELVLGAVVFVVGAAFDVAHHDVVGEVACGADLPAFAFLVQ